ncbi:hypothetical protein T10_6639 [Trichinella papuae]|uniref:Uncharacterized protein n=1 Tax=Trichinella papuae TaxID=268474 RepID=A0A0V1MK60_9BILA|nr:hypothetical protein T10_6639 [Trichinella papuae]
MLSRSNLGITNMRDRCTDLTFQTVVSFMCPSNQAKYKRHCSCVECNHSSIFVDVHCSLQSSYSIHWHMPSTSNLGTTQVRDRCTDLVWQESLYSFLEQIQN